MTRRSAVRPWSEMQAAPTHIKLKWVEVALDGERNNAPGMWRATKADLRAGVEWYLDQADLRNLPYIGLCEAFLDENAEQEQGNERSRT